MNELLIVNTTTNPELDIKKEYDFVYMIDLNPNSFGESSDYEVEINKIIDFDSYFQDTAQSEKSKYVEKIDDLAYQTTSDQSLVENLRLGDVSFWWSIENIFKHKSADFNHPFNQYCRARVLGDIVEKFNIDEVYIETPDYDIYNTLSNAVEKNDVNVVSTAPNRNSITHLKVIIAFLTGLLNIFIIILRSIVSRGLERLFTVQIKSTESDQLITFFSLPSHWRATGWKNDRYFSSIPSYLENDGIDYFYCLPLVSVYPRELFSDILNIIRLKQNGKNIYLTESNLTLIDYLRIIHKYLIYVKKITETISQIENDLIPLSDRYVKKYIIESIIHVPTMISTEYSMRKFRVEYSSQIDQMVVTRIVGNPTQVVTKIFEDEIPVIGLQHGPITTGKLQYYRQGKLISKKPKPDIVGVDGPLARRVLISGGYPGESISITGGARYDDLFCDNKNLSRSKGGSEKITTVFFGLDDYKEMASVLEPLPEITNHQFYLKPHPSAKKHTKQILEESLNLSSYSHLNLTDRSVNNLLRKSDKVIASYSSTAIESLLFNRPVIRIRYKNKLDVSPFARNDISKGSDVVSNVSSPRELEREMEKSHSVDKEDVKYFLEDYFYILDGGATRRACELIKREDYSD